MEKFIFTAVINLGAALIFMISGWIVSLIIKKASIADRMWGLGFVIIAWLTFYNSNGFLPRQVILLSVVTVWGMRLFIHITMRSWGKEEDPRYGAWRKEHGSKFWLISLFKVFIIQAIFMFNVSLGVQLGILSSESSHLTLFDYAGLAIWITGFIIESSADRQLKTFLNKPQNAGKIMNKKLWSLSRHPNYFGESLQWWGIFIIVLSCPFGYVTIISPVLITYSLLKISGVTMMESVEFSDNPEYIKYVEETNAFIPWFKKVK